MKVAEKNLERTERKSVFDWWRVDGKIVDKEELPRLKSRAEDHIAKMVSEGLTSGELEHTSFRGFKYKGRWQTSAISCHKMYRSQGGVEMEEPLPAGIGVDCPSISSEKSEGKFSSVLSYRTARARAEQKKLRADHGLKECFPHTYPDMLCAVNGDTGDAEETVAEIWLGDNGVMARNTAKCLAHCYNHFDKLLDSLEKCVGLLDHVRYFQKPLDDVTDKTRSLMMLCSGKSCYNIAYMDKVLRDAKACLEEALTLESGATVEDVHRRAMELLWGVDTGETGKSSGKLLGQLREEFGDELYEQAVKEGLERAHKNNK